MEAEKDLLDVISCKARGHDSEFLGIATIITPSFAVIPNVTLPSPESPEPTLFLNFEQLPEYYTAQAFMAAHDSELNVSLLKLDPPVPFDLSSLRFADTPTLFTLGAEWRTLGFEGDTVTAPHVKGRIGEPDTLTEGSKQIRLDPYPDTVGQAGAGAPVLIEDRLIGVVTATDEATGVIYAIPFSEIVKSESFAEVRKLIAKQDADSPDPPVETGPAAKTGAPPQKRRKLIPGFSSDDAKGEDKLDIKREVEALCSVIAAKDVEPPVSVGLFGDWGSGKSFFMRKMEENINTLKTQARANPKSPYCPNIVQLWFNAWHYMDTDLWASLASEIFEGLAEQLAREAQPKSEQDPSYKRARLVADRASSLSKLEQAEKELRQVEAQLSQNVQSLARLGEEIAPDTSPQALLREGLQFALRQPEVIDQIAQGRREFETKMREAAKQLNVPAPELFELRGVAGRLRAVKLALTNTRNLKKWLVAVGSLFVFAVAALLLSQWSLGLSDRLSRIIAAATGLLGFLSPFIYSGLRAINLIKDAVRTNKVNIESARKAKEDDLLRLQKDIQIKLDAAKLGVETARSQLKSNDDQLQQLTVNRQMADFIKARHQSTDYTRLLGTIARARSDFEKLSHLLASERDLGHKPGANLPGQPTAVDPLLPRIDRIVLYIDDLDRCPERKVVEVLQAVHLLLAFPLFVVVVGVDSRWLLHSLKQHSRAFRGLPADIQSHPEDAHWQSTPLNYLEKIFQIPFTLWPMEKEGFGNLIESLVTQQGARQGGDAEDKRQAGRERTEQDEAEKSRAASVGGSASRVTTPTRTSGNPDPVKSTGDTGMHQYGSQGETQTAANSEKQTSQEQSQDLAPEHLLIEEWERDFMKRLYGFIPSPRSAKRFVNIYRILRAWVKDHEVEAFKGDKNGGGHRAALLLLAILIGYPDEATEVLGRLLDVDEKISWWGFIEDLKREFAARVPAGIKPEGIKGAQPDEVQTDEPQKDEPQKYAPARWEEFIEKLEKTRAMRPSLIAEGQPCKDFKTWAPRVARYSFQSGRVLLTQMIGDASEQTNIRPPRLK